MTITHLNRFHLRAARKDTKVSDLSLNNIFSKLLLGLWVSLLEIEFNLLITENEHFTKSFLKEISISRKTLTQKWKALLDYYFKKIYFKKQDRALTISNLGHTAFHRYETLKNIIQKDLALFVELRNRVAHGQWAVAFNTDLLDKNQDLTTHMWKLTKKEMLLLKSLHKNLPPIFKLLITSKKTFERDYDKYINRIIKGKADNDLIYAWLIKKK